MITKPIDRTTDVGAVMSNFDRLIDDDVARAMVSPDAFAVYAGWDFFCPAVWVDNEQFHCEVWVTGSHVASYSTNSLTELMEVVSDEHGWD